MVVTGSLQKIATFRVCVRVVGWGEGGELDNAEGISVNLDLLILYLLFRQNRVACS